MVHSHFWGHFKPMLDAKDVKLVGMAETNPDLVAEAKKARRDAPVFDRLQEDAG